VDIDEVVKQVTTTGCACRTSTTGKRHSFIGTDVYIQIIFISSKTNEYKVILIGLGQEPMNIWAIRFDFDWPHIFVGWPRHQ
jgi:hypothetical protein